MSRIPSWYSSSAHCFPRVSGDEPAQVTMRFNQEVFSPRERG